MANLCKDSQSIWAKSFHFFGPQLELELWEFFICKSALNFCRHKVIAPHLTTKLLSLGKTHPTGFTGHQAI